MQRYKMVPDDTESGNDEGRPAWLSNNVPDDLGSTSGSEFNSLSASHPIVGPSEDASWLETYQNLAGIAAHIFALATLIIVGFWVSALGGVSWKDGEAKLVFNWYVAQFFGRAMVRVQNRALRRGHIPIHKSTILLQILIRIHTTTLVVLGRQWSSSSKVPFQVDFST